MAALLGFPPSRRAVMLLLVALIASCGQADVPSPAAAPAAAAAIIHETDLLKLTLTAQAEQRLGIVTYIVEQHASARLRVTRGEIVVPTTSPAGIPITSASNLAQIGAQQAAADGEIARARAAAHLARIAHARADALVREEAGSLRARDEAAAALATAMAAEDVALVQRRLLGPPVSVIGEQSVVWVRVPVFATDVSAILPTVDVTVHSLGVDGPARKARPVTAPPSANPVAGTVDFFYALDNGDLAYRVGESVGVTLPLTGATQSLAVPASAIVRDIYGGEWVYERTAPGSYLRRRVELVAVDGGQATVARGLERGAAVVAVGAAELFGIEFGVGH